MSGAVTVTLPDQRTRAVLQARDLLRRLASAYTPDGIKNIRTEIRKEAREILRHYPIAFEIGDPSSFCDHAITEWYKAQKEKDRERTHTEEGSRTPLDDLGGPESQN